MFPLRIAIRYLFSKKTHNAVNVISLISVLGIAVATMAIVCVLSVFNGFSALSAKQLSRFDPEIKITPKQGKVIENADSLVSIINSLPSVSIALPTIEEQALAMFNEHQMPVKIKGLPPNYDEVIDLAPLMIDGEYLVPDSIEKFAALSIGVAINLQARPNPYSDLEIYVPRRTGHINPANPMTAFRSDTLIVGGVYQVEHAEYDADMVVMPLADVRRLLEYTTEASAIEVASAHNYGTDTAIADISAAIGDNYMVKDRHKQQEQSFRMISIEKWITFMMLAFILIIASFNIISTLSMLVIEKDENITTFNAMGASHKMISRIFMLEGWLISMVGGIIGIIVGVVLSLLQQWGGFIKLNGDPSALSIDSYPVIVKPIDLLLVLALVAIVGFLTSQVTSVFTRQRLRTHTT